LYLKPFYARDPSGENKNSKLLAKDNIHYQLYFYSLVILALIMKRYSLLAYPESSFKTFTVNS
jgi:hypothetical protein